MSEDRARRDTHNVRLLGVWSELDRIEERGRMNVAAIAFLCFLTVGAIGAFGWVVWGMQS